MSAITKPQQTGHVPPSSGLELFSMDFSMHDAGAFPSGPSPLRQTLGPPGACGAYRRTATDTDNVASTFGTAVPALVNPINLL